MSTACLERIINSNGNSPQDWKNILTLTSSNPKE